MYPANTQRRCNVVTLQRRCNDVPATLYVCWVKSHSTLKALSKIVADDILFLLSFGISNTHTLLSAAALKYIRVASNENVPSNMRKLRGFKSSCTCTKYHPGLCPPFIHSLVANDSVSVQSMP